MASLKLDSLNKVYPSGAAALYNVSLETLDNEFIAVVGGEASGKSTLLRVISGLEDATSGTISVDGKDVTEADPKDRNMAMVFRGGSLYATMNVYDNMAFGLKQRNAPQAIIEKRVKIVADMLGLTEVLYRKPKALTAAEKQRVALGRAVAREPRLYLFDDPLSGLDEKLRLELLNVIVNVQARVSGAFIYATKNLSEAMALATRIVVLKSGLVQQIDTPANLYDYPNNVYVAYFIGVPAINFLKAKIVKSAQGYAAVSGSVKIELAENIVKRFENIEDYADKDREVYFGIRPEDGKTVKVGGDLKARIKTVEKDGERVYAECILDDGVSMIFGGQPELKDGEEAEIKVDNTRLYFFDGATRLTLLSRDEGYKKTDNPNADFMPMPYEEELAVIENLKPKKESNKKKLR